MVSVLSFSSLDFLFAGPGLGSVVLSISPFRENAFLPFRLLPVAVVSRQRGLGLFFLSPLHEGRARVETFFYSSLER